MRPQQPLIPTWIRAFGGVCQSPVGEHVPLGLLASAQNYELSPSGELVPRRGRKRLTDISTPDGTAVRVIAPLDFDGVTRILVASEENIYEVSGDTWTYICTNPGSKFRPTFALFNSETNPFVVFGHEDMDLMVWNGTTLRAAEGGAPRGRPVAYNNYLVVFGIKDNPGFVQFAIQNGNPDLWIYGDSIRGLDVQGKVTSAFTFNGLLIMTRTRAKLFVGDPSLPESSYLQDLSSTIGCVCHETVVQAEGDGGIIWASIGRINGWSGGGAFPTMDISNPGVGEPNSATDPRPVSSNIAKDVLEINWDDPLNMSAAYWPEKRQYLFSAQNATGEIKTWCLDLDKRAWLPWTANNTAMAHTVGLSMSPVGRMLCGDGSGTLYAMGENQYYDDNKADADGTRYSWFADLVDWNMGYPNSDKIVRAITVGSRGNGKRQFSASVNPNFGTPFSVSELTEFILGVSLLGDRLTGEVLRSSATASINPGGLSLGSDVLGASIAEEKTYTERRIPMAARGVNFRLRVFADPSSITADQTYDAALAQYVWKLFQSDGSVFVDIPFATEAEAKTYISNQFAVPIAALCVTWRTYAIRHITIDSHLPSVVIGGPYLADEEQAAIAPGVEVVFKNVSTNVEKAKSWVWEIYLEDVLLYSSSASSEITYTFADEGTYQVVLKGLVDYGPPITDTNDVIVVS